MQILSGTIRRGGSMEELVHEILASWKVDPGVVLSVQLRNDPNVRAIRLLHRQDKHKTRDTLFGVLVRFSANPDPKLPIRQAITALVVVLGNRGPRIPPEIGGDLNRVVNIWLAWGQHKRYVH